MRTAVMLKERDLESESDRQLVDAARQGSETAIRALVRRNNKRLFRVARSIVASNEEAEDVVQETYFRAFTKLDLFRGESLFSTWITRIALNEALGRVRQRRSTAELSVLDSSAGLASVIRLPTSLAPEAADAELGRRQVRDLLERIIDDLPEAFRTVFILRDVEEMSTEETAYQLSLKPETVKTRLHRARRLVRAAVEKRLSAGFSDLFPFDGVRCVRMADRVVERLRASGLSS
jgi:RNA polymerase sigma-70 factor (ECF subfamily)